MKSEFIFAILAKYQEYYQLHGSFPQYVYVHPDKKLELNDVKNTMSMEICEDKTLAPEDFFLTFNKIERI